MRRSTVRRVRVTKKLSVGRLAEMLEPRRLLSTNVLTSHNDLARTGLNDTETQLTPADVSVGSFGKLFSYSVDGQLYAQPLYVSGLSIPGKGTHDVVIVATETDNVYAFDADSNGASGGLLWKTNLGKPAALPNPVIYPPGERYGPNIAPWYGITGTPVIDLASNRLYVDAFTDDGNGAYSHNIHALDLTTGLDAVTPVKVAATVPGNGVNGNGTGLGGSGGTTVTYDATRELQRPALALVNGTLYVTYGSFSDGDFYHGWVLGFDPTSLQLQSVFNDTPNLLSSPAGPHADEGAFWQTGAAPSSDGTNLYLMSGNGDFNASIGDYGDSFIKLDTTNALAVSGYFTPQNQLALSNADEDLGSGGPMVLPDSVGSAAHPDLLIGCGKQGLIYLIDRNNMGGFSSTSDNVVQEVNLGSGTWSSPAYFNGRVYFHGVGDVLKAFSISNGVLSTSPVATGSVNYGYPGATPSISANGTINGIVWDIQTGGILHAYDAVTLQQLYNSSQAPQGRDSIGSYENFILPTVADGKVFVGSANSVVIFGLLPAATSPPAAPSNLTASQGFGVGVTLTWTNNANNELNFQVERSTDGTNFTNIATVPAVAQGATAAYTDTNTTVGQTYYYRVLAFNKFNGGSLSNPSNNVSITVSTPKTVFLDTYSTDTSGNYTETTQTPPPSFVDSWKVSNGTLNYTVSTNNTWNSSVFLLNASVASTTGLPKFTTSGDIIGPQNYQPGLILTGDTNSGGFDVQEYNAGQFANHLVLLQETGAQLLGDEGGTGNPPVLADFGDISGHLGDTFHVSGAVDRTGAHPVITVSIIDLTSPSFTLPTKTVTATSVPANYGGTQIGWRARWQSAPATFSVDNLSLQLPAADHAPAAPTSLTATQGSGSNVILKWTNAADNAMEFEIQRSTDGTNFTNVTSVPAGAQNATVTYTDAPSITVGQTLYYRVLAFNGYNGGTFSAPSNVASIIVTIPTVSFRDDYATDTTRYYTETSENPGGTQDSFTVSNGTLNYSVQSSDGSFNSSLFLLSANVASSAATPKFTTSGDIVAPGHNQPGLVLAGDSTNGGFVVQEFENPGPPNYVGHLVLLRETGAELLGDEGGTGNPPVLADLGDISQHLGDTFRILGTIDRTGTNPVISVSVTDLTDSTFTLPQQTVTDTADPATFGGSQIGWRVRTNSAAATVSFHHLGLQSTATGSQDVITDDAGDEPVVLKQITGGYIQWAFGSLVGSLSVNDPNGLTVNDLGGTDSLELDVGVGSPLPSLLKLNGSFTVSDPLSIGAGQKVVLPPSATAGANSLTIDSITIDPAGTLDIGNGAVRFAYTSASPLASIQGYLKGGQIVSSATAGNPKWGIADIDQGRLQDPPAMAVLLQPALIGDTNADGKVDFTDLVALARNYGQTNADWAMGDFDYDGKVDFTDFVALARNYGATAAASPANAGLAALGAQTSSLLPDALPRRKSTRRH